MTHANRTTNKTNIPKVSPADDSAIVKLKKNHLRCRFPSTINLQIISDIYIYISNFTYQNKFQ